VCVASSPSWLHCNRRTRGTFWVPGTSCLSLVEAHGRLGMGWGTCHPPSSSPIITSTVQSRSTDTMIFTRKDGYPAACSPGTTGRTGDSKATATLATPAPRKGHVRAGVLCDRPTDYVSQRCATHSAALAHRRTVPARWPALRRTLQAGPQRSPHPESPGTSRCSLRGRGRLPPAPPATPGPTPLYPPGDQIPPAHNAGVGDERAHAECWGGLLHLLHQLPHTPLSRAQSRPTPSPRWSCGDLIRHQSNPHLELCPDGQLLLLGARGLVAPRSWNGHLGRYH
jgi:hypothetical protein